MKETEQSEFREEIGLSSFFGAKTEYTLRTTADTFTLRVEPGSFLDETLVLVGGLAMPRREADIIRLQGRLEEFLKKGRK